MRKKRGLAGFLVGVLAFGCFSAGQFNDVSTVKAAEFKSAAIADVYGNSCYLIACLKGNDTTGVQEKNGNASINALDGAESTVTMLGSVGNAADKLIEGDYVGVVYDKTFTMNGVSFLFATNKNDAITKYVIEYTTDGSTWTRTTYAGEITEADSNGRYGVDISFESPIAAKGVRITNTDTVERTAWLQISEIRVDYDNNNIQSFVNVKAPSAQTANNQGPEKVADGQLGTKWHTLWGNSNNAITSKKNWIDFELESAQVINELGVYNVSSSDNGSVIQYEVWVSNVGDTTCDAGGSDAWQDAYEKVCSGKWNSTSAGWKKAQFEAVSAKYVRFVAVETGGWPANTFVAIPEMYIAKATSTVDDSDFFLGGSLRKTGYSDNTLTAMRFGYDIPNMDGYDNEPTWKWNWGTDPSNLEREVTGVKSVANGTGRVSNLVITDIPSEAYKTPVFAQLTITYTNTANEEHVVYTAVQERSVKVIVNAILGDSNAEDDDKTYAESLGTLID